MFDELFILLFCRAQEKEKEGKTVRKKKRSQRNLFMLEQEEARQLIVTVWQKGYMCKILDILIHGKIIFFFEKSIFLKVLNY